MLLFRLFHIDGKPIAYKNEAVRSECLGKTQNLVLIDRTACCRIATRET